MGVIGRRGPAFLRRAPLPAAHRYLRRSWRSPWFVALVLLVGAALVAWWLMLYMPGTNYRGPLAPLSAHEVEIRAAVRRHVEKLAGEIGERHLWRPAALTAAAEYIHDQLAAAGLRVEKQTYRVGRQECDNIEAELPGRRPDAPLLIVGAHYDSVSGCPAANDNASGVAALLVLARELAARPVGRTLRFVAFVNEEPPHSWTPEMGSFVYARRCQARGERIAGMISLETIGYYSDAPGSQSYPFPLNLLYPDRGDFIAFVGNVKSRRLVRESIGAFRRHTRFPSEGVALPALVPDAGRSDHWSFWQHGFPALMVTDTAPFRYPHYHTADDTSDKLDYERLARVVAGLVAMLRELAGER